MVAVHAMESLLHTQVGGVWTPRMVQPCSVVRAVGLDNKRVVIHPFANRVAVPARLRIFGMLAHVCPYDAPDAIKLVKNDYGDGRLNDLRRAKLEVILARKSLG